MDAPADAAEHNRGGSPPDMAGRARLAVAWATGFQLFRDVVQFGLTITLVRLLPAEVYGQFGFFTTLLTFFTIYSFREFLNHTLQVRGGDVVHYQDHFTAGAVVQAIVVVVVNGVAIGLRWFPAYAAVSPVLHVMSVLFVLDLPSEFRVKMLERELDWRRLRFLQGVGFVVGGLVSVALALSGVRVLALLLPTLIAPLPFIYDLFVTARWRPTWAFDWDRFRPAWRFGWTRIATVSFVSVASLTETTWLTGVLGFALLGIYGRAMGLAQLLCGRIAGLLSLAVYPVLTRLTPDTDSYRRASAMYLRTVGWAVVPLAAIFSMLAAPVVNLIYGKTWIEAIPLVPFAMAVAAVSAIAQTAYTLLLASGRQGPCLVADAWRLAGTLIALVVALPFGAAGYLVAMSALQCVSLVIVVGFLLRGRAVTPAGLLQAIVPALVSTGLAAGAASIGAAGSPVATGVVFFGVYVVALRVLFASACAELVGYLPQSGRLSRWLRLAPPTPA